MVENRKAAGTGDLGQIERSFNQNGSLTSSAGRISWPFDRLEIPADVQSDPQQILDNAIIYTAAWGQLSASMHCCAWRSNQRDSRRLRFCGHRDPLRGASWSCEMVDHLLKVGADPSIVDTKIQALPENWASHNGHHELAVYLRGKREQQLL